METLTIDSKSGIKEVLNIKNIISYRDLLVELVMRDIKMRHKQTILGVAWVIFQPLLSTIIFTIIFGSLFKTIPNGLPYPLFIFIGFNFWNFFANSLTVASGSLVGNEALIKKIYFPRIIIPIATIGTNLFDLLISTLFLVLLVFLFEINPNPLVYVFFPIAVILILMTNVGLGLFLAALNVRYRDVKQVLPFFIQILIFLTPVFYPVTIITSSNRWILAFNPLTTAIEMVRNTLSVRLEIDLLSIAISFFVSLIIFSFGLWYFAKTESYFADLI